MKNYRLPGEIFYPEELAVVQRVFDWHCATFGYRRKSHAAEDLADVVMTLFKMGYTGEVVLADAVASREMLLKVG